jgi:16S rRNA (cytidine1402-2'-O)-methyltransferase
LEALYHVTPSVACNSIFGSPWYSLAVSGKLFIVATPLGNLDDVSSRARSTLQSVDCIACEDTRRTAKLLARHEIKTPTLSCHRFNEMERLEPILRRLSAGENIALVSDGGTPGISDPGALLINAALERKITVVPIPGASAVTTLLSCSGLPADSYVFEGFLPHRGGERRIRLRQLRSDTRTLVFFESPHRIGVTLQDIHDIFGERLLVIGRELTKRYETILRGTAAEITTQLGPSPRGEFTIAMAGASGDELTGAPEERSQQLLEGWHKALSETGGDRRRALKLASRNLGLKRAELYRSLVELGAIDDQV